MSDDRARERRKRGEQEEEKKRYLKRKERWTHEDIPKIIG